MNNNSNESGNNNSLHPLTLAMVLSGGILLGYLFKQNSTNSSSIFAPQSFDKLESILEYIDNEYVDTVNIKELEEKTIAEMLAGLDPHSFYIPAEETQGIEEDMQGNFEGIGIQFQIKDDTISVEAIISDGPSEKVGLQAGDKIIYVNDSLVAGKNITNNDVMKLLKGPKGTKVKLKVLRDNDYLEYGIIRDKIPIYSVDAAYMINKEVAYIKVNRFAATTYEEFMVGMQKMKNEGMKKLILDLRGNPGGYLQAAYQICDELLSDKKLVVFTEGVHQKRMDYITEHKGIFEEGDLVVLIDEYSASASEILSGAIQDWDRGVVLGRRSFGKGLVQDQYDFPDHSALRLTIAKYYTPSGRCIQKSYENMDNYYSELNERYDDGELLGVDSAGFHQDTVKYYTLVEKRPVYGGGGINPDIFVPLDTAMANLYVARVRQYANEFTLSYLKQHTNLDGQYNENTFAESFQLSNADLDLYYTFIKGKGYKEPIIRNAIYDAGMKKILKFTIAKQVFKNSGYYKALNQDDKMIDAALKALK